VILEPLRIVKSFSPNPVAVGVSSTLSFAVNNPNVIAVDASFTDTLPAGLVVAATPGVTIPAEARSPQLQARGA